MIVGSEIRTGGHWTEAADTITLDETARHRRRMAMVSDGGIAFLLDLPEAVLLAEGDAILLDDGRLIAIRAKPEELYEVRGRDAAHLLLLAWHAGSRHLPAQVFPDRFLLRRDAAVREALEGLGAKLAEIEAAFDPEAGARHAGDPLPPSGG